ncbi:uncharacterized protein [Dysidea avara]|uniref:uncharacterized protein isoform X2 n=1 Tax=Dysidea avara TaxID=196820 RepID=UPI00332E816A
MTVDEAKRGSDKDPFIIDVSEFPPCSPRSKHQEPECSLEEDDKNSAVDITKKMIIYDFDGKQIDINDIAELMENLKAEIGRYNDEQEFRFEKILLQLESVCKSVSTLTSSGNGSDTTPQSYRQDDQLPSAQSGYQSLNKITSPMDKRNKGTTSPMDKRNKGTTSPMDKRNKRTTSPMDKRNNGTTSPMDKRNKGTTSPTDKGNKGTTSPMDKRNNGTTSPTDKGNKGTNNPMYKGNKEPISPVNKEPISPINKGPASPINQGPASSIKEGGSQSTAGRNRQSTTSSN